MATALGERILKLLKEKGMRQQTLAQNAGVTEAAVSHYINGDRSPRANILARIAEVLGTSSDYLMNGTSYDSKTEVSYAMQLIRQNAEQMTKEEKMQIISILLGEE